MPHIIALEDEELGALYFEIAEDPASGGFSKKISRDEKGESLTKVY